MHYGRIVIVVGAVLGAIGFIPQSASSAGEELLPQLSQANPAFPSGFDSTFTALYNDTAAAAIIYLIAAIAALGTTFMPPFKEAMNRMMALTATVLGVVMLVIGVFSTMGASDDASTLQDAFGQAAAGGLIPEAYTVSIGWGWYLLILAGVVVAVGGVLSLMARPNEDALSA